ncbi:MAG: RnfABCDGE type electron transport complex subunit G [Lachnospiraceae bacterium]|nr:RnfABCDGE type electron transport complex subunit G [Lachnospiraceae bacterium]MDD5852735.1 RnfABCDGE type electron transport complex subunit G [Lachnospiraceae bacterium]
MKTMLKEAGILFAITLIAGCLLGLVYQVTKEPIAEAQQKAKDEACKEVFADAEGFVLQEDISSEDASSFVQDEGYNVSIDEVLEAQDASGSKLGYVITVTDHEGYGGDIQFSIGIRNDGTVNGISILSISETAGLGMNADSVLKPQFEDKNVEQFEYTKTGAPGDNQIDAISGATITTNAVVNGVNAGITYFRTQLMEGGSANE